MEYMPNEVLDYIFDYSSKRSIIECSKVCKKWHQLTLTPQYYSTIHIYTLEQLKKFLQLANNDNDTRLIDNKPVGYYVHYLNIHTDDISIEDGYISTIFKTFPNIQDIKGLIDLKISTIPNLSHIFNTQLQHLTHFSSWYTSLNHNWMNCIDSKVTILDFQVDRLVTRKNQENQIIQQQQQQQQQQQELQFNYSISSSSSTSKLSLSDQFYIKIIGEEKRKLICFNDSRLYHGPELDEDDEENQPVPEIITYNSKIIMLPTLNYLVKLKLQFGNVENNESYIYEFDERTFESIHQSCPILESLKLDQINMNISEDYDKILQTLKDEKRATTGKASILSSSPILANNLKQFHFTGGVIHDPRCYTYFLNKYPKLGSLNLQLEWYHPNLQLNIPFKLALFDLITHSSCLKSLEFNIVYFNNYDDQIYINEQYWPTVEFSTWLKNNPNQLTSLNYPYDITTINEDYKEMEVEEIEIEINNNNNNNNNNDDDLNLTLGHWIAQTNYLNHLKRLSITITKSIQSTLSYFTINNKRQIASLSLEELEIMPYNAVHYGSQPFYIYHWLDAFPNLLKLTLIRTKLIKDIPSATNHLCYECFLVSNEIDDEMIDVREIRKKEIKEKGIIVNDNGSNGNNSFSNDEDDGDDQPKTYKLQELSLHYSSIYFKHGFSSFSKKCPHINKLTFEDVEYAMVDWQISEYQQFISQRINEKKGKIEKKLYYQTNKKPNEYPIIETTFDLSNMDHLNYLCISGFKYIPWIGINHDNSPKVDILNIKETSYYKRKYKPVKQIFSLFDIFFCKEQNVYKRSIKPYTLNIICKSIFDLYFI